MKIIKLMYPLKIFDSVSMFLIPEKSELIALQQIDKMFSQLIKASHKGMFPVAFAQFEASSLMLLSLSSYEKIIASA